MNFKALCFLAYTVFRLEIKRSFDLADKGARRSSNGRATLICRLAESEFAEIQDPADQSMISRTCLLPVLPEAPARIVRIA